MKKTILFSALFTLLWILSAEGGVDFFGEIQTQWGAAAPWTDQDSNAGRFTLGETAFTGSLDAYYDNSSAFADISLSYDAVSNDFNWSLNELWLDYTSSFWGIRIGRQKTAWGKADGIDITNVICPADMSSFAAMVSDDSKLAIDAVRLSISGNQFTADAYWIPFFTPAALPDSTLSVLPVEKPETAIWNGEYGLKLSGYFPAFDASLYGFYGWDDNPLAEYIFAPNGQLLSVIGKYKRMAMIGADAAIPIKEVVLRAETAFFPMRYFTIDEQRNELSGLIGLDWMPEGWTLTAQYFCDVVFGDTDLIGRKDAYTHGATLSVSKSLLNETMELSFSGIINFNDFDSLMNPSVNYSLSDQIKLEAGAYILLPGPEGDGQYGAYKDLSTIYIKGKYSF